MAKNTRNVLFIVVDQWRGDTLPSLGQSGIRAPNLERLMRKGTTFTRHYCQAAPCGPARASLLTGTYQMTHRVVGNGTPLDAGLENLAGALRNAGYDPALTGYTSTTPDPRVVPPQDPCFESTGTILDGFTPIAPFSPGKRPYLAYLKTQGYALPGSDALDTWLAEPGWSGQRGPTYAPSRIAARHSDTAWFTDKALEYLDGAATQPWFLHLGYWRPHPPFTAPREYHDRYHPDDVPAPLDAGSAEEVAAQHPLANYFLRTQQQKSFFRPGGGLVRDLSEQDFRQLRATYYGLIEEIDDHLGRIFAWLDAHDRWQDTLVIFTGDHGEQLGDRHLLGKLGHWDESYHVPLIVVDPDAAADSLRGQRIDRFTESVDIFPTIMAWLEQPIPSQVDGRSLLPLVHDRCPDDWRRDAHWEFDFRDVRNAKIETALDLDAHACALCVLRDEKWKYVYFNGLPPLLFDLENDPNQRIDLASDPGYRHVRLEYAEKMLAWRLRHANRSLTHYMSGPGGLYPG
jgi:arylsulfatase A-like enzyme